MMIVKVDLGHRIWNHRAGTGLVSDVGKLIAWERKIELEVGKIVANPNRVDIKGFKKDSLETVFMMMDLHEVGLYFESYVVLHNHYLNMLVASRLIPFTSKTFYKHLDKEQDYFEMARNICWYLKENGFNDGIPGEWLEVIDDYKEYHDEIMGLMEMSKEEREVMSKFLKDSYGFLSELLWMYRKRGVESSYI